MLKSILVLVALVAAIALMAPDYFARLGERGRENAVLAVPVEKQTQASPDHGGILRISADPRGQYATEIEVNHRTVLAVVDTGATLMTLRYEDANRLGLIFPGDKYDVRIRTANGEGRAKRVLLRSVGVGPITIRDVEALALEQGALNVNLLGMSFLRRLSRFEVQRGQLVLER